jgi:hypothetical protein
MRGLIIDNSVKAEIKALMKYAEKNPYSMDDLLDIVNGSMESPGDQREFQMYIPMGYKVVYTMEIQNVGLVRHISISVNTPGKLPGQEVVTFIIPFFGFKRTIHDNVIKIEGPKDGLQSINIWEPLTPA